MTTFGIDAECGRLIEYDTAAELRELCKSGELDGVLPLGGGSNILFTGACRDLTVIHCRNTAFSIRETDNCGIVEVSAAAGCVLDTLCEQTAAAGLWGLENLSGIPGEIGGAVVQNVGAYGAELGDVVASVNCLNVKTNEFVTLTGAECHYGYRDSVFKHHPAKEQLIVTEAVLTLRRDGVPNLSYSGLKERIGRMSGLNLSPTVMRGEVMAMRNGKLPDPKKTGSAGSFFKNPVVSLEFHAEIEKRYGDRVPGHKVTDSDGLERIKLSAAWLIDKSGCKQFSAGGASLWPLQPLVIVNTEGAATGADVINLEKQIIATVRTRFGVELVPEVIHI